MSALPQPSYETPEKYLAMERTSPIRHEYFQGELFAMAGASRKHNLVNLNTSSSLNNQLETRPCEVYANDMRVRVSPRHYTYPDVVVVCGEPRFEDAEVDTLLNPTVIIEVASQSTEDYDRGMKFQYYRAIESLQDYIVISQDQVSVEHYTRQGIGWFLSELTTLESSLDLPSISCQLPLAKIYQKVTFEGVD